jgi:hypothetical protein
MAKKRKSAGRPKANTSRPSFNFGANRKGGSRRGQKGGGS